MEGQENIQKPSRRINTRFTNDYIKNHLIPSMLQRFSLNKGTMSKTVFSIIRRQVIIILKQHVASLEKHLMSCKKQETAGNALSTAGEGGSNGGRFIMLPDLTRPVTSQDFVCLAVQHTTCEGNMDAENTPRPNHKHLLNPVLSSPGYQHPTNYRQITSGNRQLFLNHFFKNTARTYGGFC